MNEVRDTSDRPEGVEATPKYRVRRSDFTSGISLAALIALLAILANSFHNYSSLINENLKSFQERVNTEIQKLDERLRDVERRLW